ncbi:MAG TPA: type III-A CRISPR-associated RAMP protein Csm5 [Bryobacteraceae bacterium]|nr:type III-A CRISPR-associated RAMP protein Csm5 [Bryobacteraceae bacterium]
MKYRLTCLSPLLVGDGRRLSPIDYMVWKDQVNVLDQRRIFKLLAKGPRLEGYLTQLKKAEKLDFASWGGFAQNFADRRVPFEHPSAAKYWEASHGDTLHIPTFIAGHDGPYLPGSAIKGALRTGMLFERWRSGAKPDLAKLEGERLPRRPGEEAEQRALGSPQTSFMKAVAVADSAPVELAAFKLYLLRVSTLQPRRNGGGFDLGWKQAPRGTAPGANPEQGTPIFAEMAAPGTVFEGNWRENAFFAQPEIVRALRWREPVTGSRLLAAANEYAARLLEIQKQYAATAGLEVLAGNLAAIEARLGQARANGNACVLAMGWSSGLLAKTGWLESDDQAYRAVLKQVPLYSRAIESGLPFPKTRRIVFRENRPAELPGWALLEIG